MLKKASPFRLYYLGFAIMSCITLSVIFLFVNYLNAKQIQKVYNQEKLQLVCEMLDQYIERQDNLSYVISKTKEFQPYYFRRNKYYEKELLNRFVMLTENVTTRGKAFLYYGENFIFDSDGYSRDLEMYLSNYNEDERAVFESVFQKIWNGIVIYSTEKSTCFFSSVKVIDKKGYSYATYWLEIDHTEMNENIQFVTGGLRGKYSIYEDDVLLYSNDEEPCKKDEYGVISSIADDGEILVCFQADEKLFMGSMFPLFILCILSAAILVLLFANYFEQKAYVPLEKILVQYRGTILASDEQIYKNNIEELEVVLNVVADRIDEVSVALNKEQALLKEQIMRHLLYGNYTSDDNQNIERINELFPGSYFYVISVWMEEDNEECITKMKMQLEYLSDEQLEKNVSVIYDREQKMLSILCCVEEEELCRELQDEVGEVIDSFEYKVKTGIGKIYEDRREIAVSYLESLENVYDNQDQQSNSKDFTYEKNDMYWLAYEVTQGNKEGVNRELEKFIKKFQHNKISLIMLQYIFFEFMSEISVLASDQGVKLEKYSLSILASVRTIDDFQKAVKVITNDFYAKRNNNSSNEEIVCQIENYIKTHFSDYDISIEKVAESVGTSISVVRNTIKQKTSKTYREYLASLRVEYAQELLRHTDMTVVEVCEKVGYSNVSHFVRKFRECIGVPPATWRDSLNIEEGE